MRLIPMGLFGWQELLIILVIVVIVFGGARLAGVGKASGRAIREFKDELKGPDPSLTPPPSGAADASAAPPATGSAPPGQTAA